MKALLKRLADLLKADDMQDMPPIGAFSEEMKRKGWEYPPIETKKKTHRTKYGFTIEY